MSSTSDSETEILLGNRHLLAIFFVLAILLGIAFTGGYMVGRNSPEKKPTSLTAATADPAASTATGPTSLETHAMPAAPTDQAAPEEQPAAVAPQPETHTAPPAPAPAQDDRPLGTPKPKTPPPPVEPEKHKPNAVAMAVPQSGQMFLQVAAVGHTEANGLAEALSKKGFRAHAVPKPGSSDVYRVLIGPLRDAADLSSSRDSLRSAGFTKIFVQRY